MALRNGDIEYRGQLDGGVRFQADPPVCNGCEQPVTHGNLGALTLSEPTPDGPRGLYEIVLCVTCANQEASEATCLRFIERHTPPSNP